MDFNEYQTRAHGFDEKRKRAIPILGLAGEVGSILSVFKKLLRQGGNFPGFKEELSRELGDALWYLSSIASHYDLRLGEIASANLHKVELLFKKGDLTAFDSSLLFSPHRAISPPFRCGSQRGPGS